MALSLNVKGLIGAVYYDDAADDPCADSSSITYLIAEFVPKVLDRGELSPPFDGYFFIIGYFLKLGLLLAVLNYLFKVLSGICCTFFFS